MDNAESIGSEVSPLRKSVTVACPVRHAFDTFTARLDAWWPKHRYSISQERTRTAAIEARVGGEIYEVRDDGERFAWGRVLIWEPVLKQHFAPACTGRKED